MARQGDDCRAALQRTDCTHGATLVFALSKPGRPQIAVHDVSIIIPTSNRSASLQLCLSCLLSCTTRVQPQRVYVVDNGSSWQECRRTRKIVEESGCVYLLLQHARGSASARNYGVRNSQGRWVCFLDDDVIVMPNWHAKLCTTLDKLDIEDVVGIEGKVIAQGTGLWDREVSNEYGRNYLTCHLIYRRSAFLHAGMFDEHFSSPMAEDHELAVRMLQQGRIVFAPDLRVKHRRPNLDWQSRFVNSRRRINALLGAERYFYAKHTAGYKSMRYANTFAGTYRTMLFKHAWICLKRRSLYQLVQHPEQAAGLVIISLFEQFCCWLLLAKFGWPEER
ncbi:MAG: glycosyltransferase [Chitinivibrionales bacterium]|nr:glycosyltransferase [Chitinivibrionales bacterium]